MNEAAFRVVRLGQSPASAAVAGRPELQFIGKAAQVAPRLLFQSLSRSGAGAGMRRSAGVTPGVQGSEQQRMRFNLLRFNAKGRAE